MSKKISIFAATALALATPAISWAQTTAVALEQKTMTHMIYERTFGPIGAIAGFIAMIAMWQISKKVEKEFAFMLKMFILVLLFINIGSMSFGIHGTGLLDGETSRYIERTCRLIALLTADIVALVLFLRIYKKNKPNPPASQQPTQ